MLIEMNAATPTLVHANARYPITADVQVCALSVEVAGPGSC